jgi:predicted DsbA family dithiol-disulfide isomerase
MPLKSPSKISIQVVSDVVCPFCLIGGARLDQALAALPEVDAEVHYLPFQLDPTTPKEGRDLRAHLKAKYGSDPTPMFARVEAMARESGIALDFTKVRRSVNTLHAQTFLRLAEDTHQRALAKALFEAYFFEGADINDDNVLVAIAINHGFSEAKARELLSDEAAHQETLADASALAKQGISGVPFFIFSRVGSDEPGHAISGAQPVAVLTQAIRAIAGSAAE